MSKDVIITIKDKHTVNGEVEQTELNTIGKFDGYPDDYTIYYTENGDLEGCEVSLNVKNKNCVTITRTGTYQTQLIMEKSVRHNCQYITPMGDIILGVFTNNVQSDVTEKGGKLKFDYTLDYNAGVISTNDLTITISDR